MYHNIETLGIVMSYLIKAVVLAAQFSGRARKRQLKRVAQRDIDEKDKEIFFLRDKVYQQAIQISILQKGLKKKDTNKRYPPRQRSYYTHTCWSLKALNPKELNDIIPYYDQLFLMRTKFNKGYMRTKK